MFPMRVRCAIFFEPTNMEQSRSPNLAVNPFASIAPAESKLYPRDRPWKTFQKCTSCLVSTRNVDLEACPPVGKHMFTWRERFIYPKFRSSVAHLHLQENLNTAAVTSYFPNKTALSFFPKHDGGDFLFSK
jgi:hypothetical protein